MIVTTKVGGVESLCPLEIPEPFARHLAAHVSEGLPYTPHTLLQMQSDTAVPGFERQWVSWLRMLNPNTLTWFYWIGDPPR